MLLPVWLRCAHEQQQRPSSREHRLYTIAAAAAAAAAVVGVHAGRRAACLPCHHRRRRLLQIPLLKYIAERRRSVPLVDENLTVVLVDVVVPLYSSSGGGS